ncbi:MAG: hypothetical protein IKJ50_00970, partial [Clostridia bacterium]|nr:hypothetical protein [Clostridia bacterium]
MKIKKIAAILLCVCMLLTAMLIPASAASAAQSYVKVTEAPEDWSGDYLIVYEDGANARVFNGSLTKLDVG